MDSSLQDLQIGMSHVVWIVMEPHSQPHDRRRCQKPYSDGSTEPTNHASSASSSIDFLNPLPSPQGVCVRKGWINGPESKRKKESWKLKSYGSQIKRDSTKKLSRNAFYSALKKKKTSTNISISTSSFILPSVEEKTDISKELVASNPSSGQAAERDDGFESADLPDKEEAEFLKSLGWDEKNTEVEALTDEEIRAFYEQHKEVKPLLMKKLPIITEA
ncbi:hypothetical protein Rs2_05185 [Raphanus sativus]|nr:hypothetical protein Rs2_05185 [Raphanus sativus]